MTGEASIPIPTVVFFVPPQFAGDTVGVSYRKRLALRGFFFIVACTSTTKACESWPVGKGATLIWSERGSFVCLPCTTYGHRHQSGDGWERADAAAPHPTFPPRRVRRSHSFRLSYNLPYILSPTSPTAQRYIETEAVSSSVP